MFQSGNPKTWKSFADQLDLLSDRGLEIGDRTRALQYLQRIGYYRLSGYWYPFRDRAGASHISAAPGGSQIANPVAGDRFLSGARFQDAVDLYVFDKKLRLLVLDALERIEVAVRVDVAHLLGKDDRFAYLDPSLFASGFSRAIGSDGVTKLHRWLDKQARLITRSGEDFVRHHRQQYGLPLPIWVSCEVWDFGALSSLFAGMRQEDQDIISARYGLRNGRVLASWLRSLNYLRNVCAHHSRLWNRNIIDQPKLPADDSVAFARHFRGQPRLVARPFLLFCIAQQLVSTINPTSTWWSRLTDLLEHDFPDLTHLGIALEDMGVVTDWQTFWPPK